MNISTFYVKEVQTAILIAKTSTHPDHYNADFILIYQIFSKM